MFIYEEDKLSCCTKYAAASPSVLEIQHLYQKQKFLVHGPTMSSIHGIISIQGEKSIPFTGIIWVEIDKHDLLGKFILSVVNKTLDHINQSLSDKIKLEDIKSLENPLGLKFILNNDTQIMDDSLNPVNSSYLNSYLGKPIVFTPIFSPCLRKLCDDKYYLICDLVSAIIHDDVSTLSITDEWSIRPLSVTCLTCKVSLNPGDESLQYCPKCLKSSRYPEDRTLPVIITLARGVAASIALYSAYKSYSSS